jgi:hypothetical protein
MKYKEYPEIEIPEILKDWEDTSWHNDAMPSSECPVKTAKGNTIVVWVNYPKREDREPGLQDYQYHVELRNTETGDEITSLTAETEEDIALAIEVLRAKERLP